MGTGELSDRFEQHQRLKLHVQSMRTCSFRAVGVMRAMAKLSPALRAHQGTTLLSYHTATFPPQSLTIASPIQNYKLLILNNFAVFFSISLEVLIIRIILELNFHSD